MRGLSDAVRRLCTCRQVWVKPSAEMQFLYGNHVLKSGLGRITEATPAYTGAVCTLSMIRGTSCFDSPACGISTLPCPVLLTTPCNCSCGGVILWGGAPHQGTR